MATVVDRISRSDDRFPAFCRWLVDTGMEMADLLYMIEKPSHWQAEFNEFCEKTEKPSEPDDRIERDE